MSEESVSEEPPRIAPMCPACRLHSGTIPDRSVSKSVSNGLKSGQACLVQRVAVQLLDDPEYNVRSNKPTPSRCN